MNGQTSTTLPPPGQTPAAVALWPQGAAESNAVAAVPGAEAPPLVEAGPGDYLALLKPRVMSLVVFTGLVGMLLAPGHPHPVLAATALLCIAIGAGASGAINMWFDADIDRVMARTRARPIPMGRLQRGEALGFGLVLAVGSVTVMGLAVNLLAAGLLAFTIGFYVLVYTMWLKRRTPQNIVIGGLAGAVPPAIGWAAASGGLGLEPLVLVLLIFMWTPPHFWALSLYRQDDYRRAGVPMLPVVAGDATTRTHILAYALLLAPLGVVPTLIGLVGWLYGTAAILLGAGFVALAVAVWRDAAGRAGNKAARRLFVYSILYLFLLFALLLADHAVIGQAGAAAPL